MERHFQEDGMNFKIVKLLALEHDRESKRLNESSLLESFFDVLLEHETYENPFHFDLDTADMFHNQNVDRLIESIDNTIVILKAQGHHVKRDVSTANILVKMEELHNEFASRHFLQEADWPLVNKLVDSLL